MMSFFGVHSVLVTCGWTAPMPVGIPRAALASVGILMASGMIYLNLSEDKCSS